MNPSEAVLVRRLLRRAEAAEALARYFQQASQANGPRPRGVLAAVDTMTATKDVPDQVRGIVGGG